MASDLPLYIKLLAQDLASKTIRSVSKEVGTLNKVGGHAARGLGNLAGNVAKIGAVSLAGVGAGLMASVKEAGNFEAALNTINTVARATPAELDAIGSGIRKIARDTGTSLDDLTTGYYDLVSAGIDAANAQGVLKSATMLAIGGLSTTAESIDLLTTAINTYGGDASKAAQFTDEFAKAIERGKVTAADLAASYATVGPLAASLNIENAELAAGYARLTAGGNQAGEAATQMASAMTALLKKTPDLKKLEKQTNKNYAAIAGSKGLNVALEQMRTDAKKAGIPLVELVGRKEALLYILQTTGPNMAAYNEDLAAMGNAAGTAAGQMAERQKGLNFQLDRLRANARDAAITIGSALLPKLTPLIAEFNEFLNLPSTQTAIKDLGADLADGLRDAVAWAKKLPWDRIVEGLKSAAGFARGIADAFVSLPPQAQATILALAGLNKLSGGAVGAIVGELGKGLIKGVLGMTAGVVNINAAKVFGGGGLPGGGPKGGLSAAPAAGLGLGAAGAGTLAAGIGGVVAMNLLPYIFRGREGIDKRPTLETNRNPAQAVEAVWGTISQQMTATARGTEAVRDKVSTVSADIRNGFTVQAMALKNGFTTVTAGGSRTTAELRNGFNVNQQKTAAVATAVRSSDSNNAARLSSLNAAVNRTTSTLAAKNFQPKVNVNVGFTTNVSVRAVTNGQTTVQRYTGGTSTSRTIL